MRNLLKIYNKILNILLVASTVARPNLNAFGFRTIYNRSVSGHKILPNWGQKTRQFYLKNLYIKWSSFLLSEIQTKMFGFQTKINFRNLNQLMSRFRRATIFLTVVILFLVGNLFSSESHFCFRLSTTLALLRPSCRCC